MTLSKFAGFLVLAMWAVSAHADPEHNPVAREPRMASQAGTLAVIVKLRQDGHGQAISKLASGADRLDALGSRTSLRMSLRREIASTLLASHIELGDASADQVMQRLRADPAVEYVAPDRRRFAHATIPNDTLFANQWYLQATEVAAVNAIGAWDLERGSSGVVVAVLDTGVLFDHPDLGRAANGGRLLPGYDFVSPAHMSNDGGARDADPSDPGDWVDAADKTDSVYDDCDITASSWHGTRVAGMIGAQTNNSSGVAGLSWNSPILPVRVLGKCGGSDSDILAGMRWAAGLPVAGVPDNPTPARILNASLGSNGACEPSYRDVIAELTARKVLLVISAGNEGTVVSSPANCPGVAAVAAIRHAGSKVGFSNLGPEVTLGAPGGNCGILTGGPCLYSLDTTSNNGSTGPGAHSFTNQFNSNLGTSFSAPIVSGIAALMLSRNHNLSTSQMLARLREGARPFPTSVADDPNLPTCHVPANDQDFQLAQCLCTTATCGAGMANALTSLQAAGRPIAALALPASVAPGQDVFLNATGSAAACGRVVSSYFWTVLAPIINPPAIVGADTATATIAAPASGSVTLRVVVTDDLGATDSADVVVEANRASSLAPATAGSTACAPIASGPAPGPAPAPAPAPAPPSGGGGGGSLELGTLILLGLLARRRQWRQPHALFFRCI